MYSMCAEKKKKKDRSYCKKQKTKQEKAKKKKTRDAQAWLLNVF